MTRAIQYLGLLIDEKFAFHEHARMVGQKASALFSKIARVSQLRYGMKPKTLSTIYDGVFVPIMTYGARIWADRAENVRIKAVLRSGQRRVLLRISGGYRTTSFMALTAVTGKIPIDLLVQEIPAIHAGMQAVPISPSGILGSVRCSSGKLNSMRRPLVARPTAGS